MALQIGKRAFEYISVGITGCSSKLKQAVKTMAYGERKSMLDFLVGQRVEGRRMTGLVYPDMPGLEGTAKAPRGATADVKKKYLFYKLKQGGKTTGMFCHDKSTTITLETTKKMEEHLPWWVLRPWEIINPEMMLRSGMIRSTNTRAMCAKGEPSWRAENKRRRYANTYGHNLKAIPTEFKKQGLGTNEYGGYWGDGNASVAKLVIKLSNDPESNSLPGYGMNFTSRHVSKDTGELFNRDPWWLQQYAGGYEQIEAEALLQEVAKRALKDFAEGRKQVWVGGCWNCTGAGDSIRLVMAIAERLLKKGEGACSAKNNYFLCQGKRVYYALLPYVYESPQHGDHPVSSAVLSETPVHFERVWK